MVEEVQNLDKWNALSNGFRVLKKASIFEFKSPKFKYFAYKFKIYKQESSKVS